MKHLKIVFGLVVLAGLMAVAAAPAMATPRWVECVKEGSSFENSGCAKKGETNSWSTRELVGTKAVTSTGDLELEDMEPLAGGPVDVECTGIDTGWVTNLTSKTEPGEDGVATITEIKCKFIKQGECEEESKFKPEAKPVHLPWGTRLKEEGKEVRDEIVAGTGGAAGWTVTCRVDGIIKIQDECVAEPAAEGHRNSTLLRRNPTNLSVEAVFDEKANEPMAKCSSGKKTSGLVHGTIINKLANENGLLVLAPSIGT